MKTRYKMAIIITVLFSLIFAGPLLVPVPPLQNTVPESDLYDRDSKVIEVNQLKVHYKEFGTGEPTFILLHGFGASTFSWRNIIAPLSKLGRTIAYDRPAFGLTSRPMPGEWKGENPYSPQSQTDLVIALMDKLDIKEAYLIGNSAGGTVAMHTALNFPERIRGLVLVDAAIYTGGGPPAWIRPLLGSPQMRHVGPLIARQIAEKGDDFIRSAYHDPSLVSPEVLEGYRKPLQIHNWDRALWELTAASYPLNLQKRLKELTMPVLVITGDDDRIVPTQESLRLAQEIPGATLKIIKNAGHLPHEERPEDFMAALTAFLGPQ